jgi:hypothetical protein
MFRSDGEMIFLSEFSGCLLRSETMDSIDTKNGTFVHRKNCLLTTKKRKKGVYLCKCSSDELQEKG